MTIRTLIIGALLLAATPGVLAQVQSPVALTSGWGSKGDHEPSTSYDRTGLFMQASPDVGTGISNVVYFNAFNTQPIGYTAYVDLSLGSNFASLGTAHQGFPYVAHALLGIWKDCNKDGYMGMADNALFEYRATLLLDTSVCPAVNLPVTQLPANYLFPHNDGTWIHEFLPIGWETQNMSNPDPNPMNLNDTQARVWGDAGVPGAHPSGTCYLRPEPRGTFHNAQGLLTWVDCYGSGRLQSLVNTATTTTGTTSTWNTVATLKPWGEESDASAVDAWDCSQPQTYAPGPTVIQTPADPRDPSKPISPWIYINTTNVSAPNTNPTPNTGGSAAGTMNATVNGLDQCRRTHSDGAAGDGAGYATLPYEAGCNVAPPCEADISNQPNDRFTTDQTLFFNQGSAPRAAAQLVVGKWATSDGGTTADDFTGVWSGNSITALSRNPWIDRDSLSLAGVTYATFYAYVGQAAVDRYHLVLPSTTVGAYGSEACGTHTSGHYNGWNCDASQWWMTGGTSTAPLAGSISGTPRVDVAARAGSPFNLRDVDCTDDSVAALRELGVSYGTLTGTDCS